MSNYKKQGITLTTLEISKQYNIPTRILRQRCAKLGIVKKNNKYKISPDIVQKIIANYEKKYPVEIIYVNTETFTIPSLLCFYSLKKLNKIIPSTNEEQLKD
jgi:hypothetical protein